MVRRFLIVLCVCFSTVACGPSRCDEAAREAAGAWRAAEDALVDATLDLGGRRADRSNELARLVNTGGGADEIKAAKAAYASVNRDLDSLDALRREVGAIVQLIEKRSCRQVHDQALRLLSSPRAGRLQEIRIAAATTGTTHNRPAQEAIEADLLSTTNRFVGLCSDE